MKSPPELWAEVSDASALARHLGEDGEIRITRSEPESTIAWEGEHASGTVELAPAGWGTAVTLTATTPQRSPRRRLTALFGRKAAGPDDAELLGALNGALDSLGTAHHRPFSRG